MKRISDRALAIAYVAGLTGIVLFLGGCGDDSNASSGDLTGVAAQRPDKIRAFNNIDGHPNIVELCIAQRAFVTTSRSAGENLMRFPEDDIAFCGATSASPYQPAGFSPAHDGPVAQPAPSTS